MHASRGAATRGGAATRLQIPAMAPSNRAGQPLQPRCVLRGHKAQIHVATFVRRNSRLVTGDADGFVVVWDFTIMRARAVWQAHSNAILGIAAWGHERIITHGRDNRLVVWKLAAQDEASMSTILPLDPGTQERPQPWILHILEVNTMNFCSFASCVPPSDPEALLIAVPNTLASESIDVYHLPTSHRQHTVCPASQAGMVMALTILYPPQPASAATTNPTLLAVYENGLAIVAQLGPGGAWAVTYRAQAHAAPVLSLAVAPDRASFFTSGADAVLAQHPITAATAAAAPTKTTTTTTTTTIRAVNTRHAGQQSLCARSDGRLLATAGWDGRARLYSARSLREVAVLAWHRGGCYAAAFAEGRAGGVAGAVVPRLADLSVRERRVRQVERTHWVAVGGKDGKVSLWDAF